MNIVLIGYRGTGKSIVGSILSSQLNMPCISMDSQIIEKAGMSIPEFVEQFGWDRFRDLESEIALDLSKKDQIIIDTGGGVIERPINIENLEHNAIIFWLQASVDVIISRIQDGSDRPALTSGKTFIEEISEVLERRTPKYQAAAKYIIKTDDLDPEQVAQQVLNQIRLQ